MQRVVSRSELKSEDGSESESEPEDVEDVKRNFEVPEFVETDQAISQDDKNNVEDELDFRLFAAAKPSTDLDKSEPAQKVKLRSPSVDNSNPGFIRAERDRSYYFTKALSPSEKENLQSVAFIGKEITGLSTSYRPGSAYGWKLLSIPVSNVAKSLRQTLNPRFGKLVDDEGPRGRKRPGKKARIKARVKQETLKKQQVASKAANEAKEAAEREKRTKRNREKKVKKKLRDKAKKNAAAEDEDSPSPG